MKVFLSWSGSRSKRVAEILRDWLQYLIHDIEPWMSSEDIGKGKRWSPEIAQALEDAKVGVICLTKENLNRPWLLFEAGALSKIIRNSLVCTFLLDLEQTEIGSDNPLSQFQATKNSKEDILALIKTINEANGKEKLDDKILVPTFEKWWPELEMKLSSIPSQNDEEKLPVRSEKELLAEILEIVRNIERESGTSVHTIDSSGNIAMGISGKKAFNDGWECIKRILTNKDADGFFKINSKGNNGVAIIKLSPIATYQSLSIPTREGYGIKLTFKDVNGNEIPDDAIIELWKERISGGQLLSEYEYRELKKEVKPLRDQIRLSFGEELVIYIEPKHAGIINPEFRFAVDSCVVKLDLEKA